MYVALLIVPIRQERSNGMEQLTAITRELCHRLLDEYADVIASGERR